MQEHECVEQFVPNVHTYQEQFSLGAEHNMMHLSEDYRCDGQRRLILEQALLSYTLFMLID